MLKVNFLFALLWPLVFSSDVCEQIELGNATAVCCEKNTTFRVGQVDVSFVPYRSHICPIVDGGICPIGDGGKFLSSIFAKFFNDVRVDRGRHSTHAVEK